jgi:hypothetical protein
MTLRELLTAIPKDPILKLPVARRFWQRFPVGSVTARTRYDIWERPNYAYGVYSAANLAKKLGIDRITAIEFGVARGAGLLALEKICAEIGAALDIRIAVVGFDSGQGNPKPIDYRDLPHIWGEGFYAMDEPALRAKLTSAKLVLGDVSDTVRDFVRMLPDPIGFISFDLDYYSSTVNAFKIFTGAPSTRLPRIYCYFDDILWPETACHNEFTGEYLAIREFNEQHASQKIAKLPHLWLMRKVPAPWNEQIYIFHDFEHPAYDTNIRLGGPVGENEMPLFLREHSDRAGAPT